jgi:hypothetical protein
MPRVSSNGPRVMLADSLVLADYLQDTNPEASKCPRELDG